MMARSSQAPSIGRIQKRKTNLLQIIIFGLQRAAGPYRWATSGPSASQQKSRHSTTSARPSCNVWRLSLAEFRAQLGSDSGLRPVPLV
jgi:hypothetical protein